jgi:trans-aconitate methyltransferase
MPGLIYSHPLIYQLFMRLIYGKEYDARLKTIADLIEPGWSVLDICCGDCRLKKFMEPNCEYLGLDVNPRFVEWAKKSGTNAKSADVRTSSWPTVDCVVLIASLYHFIPKHSEIILKALATAKKRVILSEPVNNLSQKSRMLSWLSSHLADPGTTWSNERFDNKKLLSFLQDSSCDKILQNGREIIGIFDVMPQNVT